MKPCILMALYQALHTSHPCCGTQWWLCHGVGKLFIIPKRQESCKELMGAVFFIYSFFYVMQSKNKN